MLTFILRRTLLAVPTLLGVLVAIFLLVRVLGDPVVMLLPPDITVTPEYQNELREALGLDLPLSAQLWIFVTSALRGDFGVSFYGGQPAMESVVQRMRPTLELAVASLAIAITVGIPLGIAAALRRNSLVDVSISAISLLGMSMPNFWLGLMFILAFGVHLQLLPISGRGGFEHLILPALTLGTGMVAIIARLIRTDVLDVLSQDYIRTAQAKGVSSRLVVWKHTLKNALIPTVTILGLQFGALLGGAVVVETVFAWPGVGRLMIQAIGRRDFPVVQAAVVLFATFFVTINILVDIAYGFLDPRIRYA
jgi:peptide/nickel transport system permease protein